MMLRTSKLRNRLVFWIVGSMLIVLLSISVLSVTVVRRGLEDEVQQRVQNLVQAKVQEMDGFLRTMARIPVVLANSVATDQQNDADVLRARIHEVVEHNPEIYGSTVSFEPRAFYPDRQYFAPYYFRGDEGIEYVQFGSDDYVYWEWEWYTGPRDTRDLYWTAPFFDEGAGDVWMTTAAYPIVREGSFIGVATVDVEIEKLKQIAQDLKVGGKGYALLLDQRGNLLVAGSTESSLEGTSIQDWQARAGDPDFDLLVGNMLEGGQGVLTLEGDPFKDSPFAATQDVWAIYMTVPSTQWRVAVLASVEEMLAPVSDVARPIVGIAVAGMAVLVMVTLFVSSTISRPLERLRVEALAIAQGDLARRVQVRTRDEIGAVGQAFNSMAEQLSQLVDRLEEQVESRTQELDRRAEELEQSNRESERRAAQLEASTLVAHAVASLLDPEALLDQVVDLISAQFGYYHVGVFLLDDVGRWAVLEAANSEGGQRMLARGHRLQVGTQGIVGDATGTGRPRVALDVGVDAVYFDNPDLPQTRSEVALPLIARGQIIGALDVQSTAENAFDERDVKVLSALADQIAVALDNARLYSASQKALTQVRAVQQQYLGQAWSDYSAQQEVDFYQYQGPHLAVPGDGSASSPLGGSASSPGELVESVEGQRTTAMDTLSGKGGPDTADQFSEAERVLQEAVDAVVSGEVPTWQCQGNWSEGEDGQPGAVVVPIRLRDQVIGALGLQGAKDEHAWDDEAVALIETVADQVAQAMEAARLLDETQRRAQRERLTSEIAGKIRAAGDIDDVLRITVREVRRALGAHYGVIRLGTETSLRPPSGTQEQETREAPEHPG